MISLNILPTDQMSMVIRKLADEYRTASDINCQSVLDVITSVQQLLETYTQGIAVA